MSEVADTRLAAATAYLARLTGRAPAEVADMAARALARADRSRTSTPADDGTLDDRTVRALRDEAWRADAGPTRWVRPLVVALGVLVAAGLVAVGVVALGSGGDGDDAGRAASSSSSTAPTSAPSSTTSSSTTTSSTVAPSSSPSTTVTTTPPPPATTAPAPATTAPATSMPLSGRVVAGDDGVARVAVRAAPVGGGTTVTATSDSGGRFTTDPVPAGRYRLEVSVPAGFVPEWWDQARPAGDPWWAEVPEPVVVDGRGASVTISLRAEQGAFALTGGALDVVGPTSARWGFRLAAGGRDVRGARVVVDLAVPAGAGVRMFLAGGQGCSVALTTSGARMTCTVGGPTAGSVDLVLTLDVDQSAVAPVTARVEASQGSDAASLDLAPVRLAPEVTAG